MSRSRAAHAANTDWAMTIFKTALVLMAAWLTVAIVAYYFVGYEGLVTVAKPFTIIGEWLAGMDMAHPGLLNTVTISATCAAGVAMIIAAVGHELPRMRAERSRHAKHAQRTIEIDEKVAAAATELEEAGDVVHYITTLPFRG